MEGWIKLHRSIESWEYSDDTEMFRLWTHLLLKASHNGYWWHGIYLKPGQVIASREGLSKVAKTFTVQKVRTMLGKLRKSQQITIETTNNYTLITIVKWDFYQNNEEKSTRKSTKVLTSDQPATNQQLTTTNNEKNVKNERSSSIPQTPKGGYAANSAVEGLVTYCLGIANIINDENDPTIRKHLNDYLTWGMTPQQIMFAIDCVGLTQRGGKTSLDRIAKALRDESPYGLKDWELKAVRERAAQRRSNERM